jgi:AcrR family transcriptional regulator
VTQLARRRRKYAPRLPREQRREQLLDAALEVLATCQLQELSMAAVALAAGVGKPVLYTAFRSRTDFVSSLLRREYDRGLLQVRDAIPRDLSVPGPGTYASFISAFVRAVQQNPARWRLIFAVPESAPREYREAVRQGRTALLTQAEMLAQVSAVLEPRLSGLDPLLLAQTMLSFAETLGRLAVSDPRTYTSQRLEAYAVGLTAFLASPRADVG